MEMSCSLEMEESFPKETYLARSIFSKDEEAFMYRNSREKWKAKIQAYNYGEFALIFLLLQSRRYLDLYSYP